MVSCATYLWCISLCCWFCLYWWQAVFWCLSLCYWFCLLLLVSFSAFFCYLLLYCWFCLCSNDDLCNFPLLFMFLLSIPASAVCELPCFCCYLYLYYRFCLTTGELLSIPLLSVNVSCLYYQCASLVLMFVLLILYLLFVSSTAFFSYLYLYYWCCLLLQWAPLMNIFVSFILSVLPASFSCLYLWFFFFLIGELFW